MKQNYISKNTAFNLVSSIVVENLRFSIWGCLTMRVLAFSKYSFKNTKQFCGLLLMFLFLSFLPTLSFSQLVINDGLPVINTNDSVIIKGGILHENNGSITNNGNFYITGDFTNNNPLGPLGNVFTAGANGWVHLSGDMQNISGDRLTHFNNLELEGTGIKYLNGINAIAEVEDTLALNDREFASGKNIVHVISTGIGTITKTNGTNGFVSSTNSGGLLRNTLSTNKYTFPVGSSTGTVFYRPVDITPSAAYAHTFKVRMANVDASDEGFDLSLKSADLGQINSRFYHKIDRINGNAPANITIYYDSIIDGDFDAMAQWKNTNQWENLGTVSFTSSGGFRGITKSGISDFSTIPFALSSEVTASVFVPNIFSPNGDGFNDILYVRGKGISDLQFIIFNRWGEKVFETTDVNKGWDGTFKGEPANLAVFVYVLKGKFTNGKTIDEKGNFTLLR